MNIKKGFTLIELLAVIVILAIIAVIAVPIVLNIIDETKSNATLRSADFYLDAVEYTISDAYLNHGGLTDGEYPITQDGNLCKTALPCSEENTIKVEVNGEVPESGTITIANGNISAINLKYGEKTIVKNSEGKLVYQTNANDVTKVCELSDEDGSGHYSVGDIITCKLKESTEQFYVIENENEDTTPEKIDMFSKYRLNVGRNAYSDGTLGIQNETAEERRYAGIEFSNDAYWLDENSNLLPQYGTSFPAYVYDSNSNLYQYVSAYEKYLKENGVASASATLINEEQFNKALNFISNSFWSGIVSEGGSISGGDDWNKDYAGVRPVVTIAKSEVNLIYEEINTEPYKPQYYYFSMSRGFIGDDLPSSAKENVSNIDTQGYPFYIGLDVDDNNKVSAAYVCFVKDEKEFCLKDGPKTYYKNKLTLQEAFKNPNDQCDFGDVSGSCYEEEGSWNVYFEFNGDIRVTFSKPYCEASSTNFGCSEG